MERKIKMVEHHDTIEKVASSATYVGGTSAVIGGMTANEIAAFGGLAVAIIGLIINSYYKHKSYKLLEKRTLKNEDYIE